MKDAGDALTARVVGRVDEVLESVPARAHELLGDAAFREDVLETNRLRAEFCGFLASVFLYELTSDQVEACAHMRFVDDGSVLARGYRRIAAYLRHRDRATAQTLAVDYAHTFLGAGTYDKIMAPPYESVFTSEERLLMQDARDKALYYYRSEELDLPADNTTPEDHLGFELQFVTHMINRSSEALAAGDAVRFCELVEKQRSFLTFHQENWLFRFCDAIDEFCKTDFYHGIADLVRGYLEVERQTLDELASELGLGGEDAELVADWMSAGDSDGCDAHDEPSPYSVSAFEAVKREAAALGAAMPRNE